MDEEQALELLKGVMTDLRPQPMSIVIRDAYVLIGFLQLAMVHPQLSDQHKQYAEHIGRQFQKAVLLMHPELEALLEAGWDRAMDVPYCPRCGADGVEWDRESGATYCNTCSLQWDIVPGELDEIVRQPMQKNSEGYYPVYAVWSGNFLTGEEHGLTVMYIEGGPDTDDSETLLIEGDVPICVYVSDYVKAKAGEEWNTLHLIEVAVQAVTEWLAEDAES